MEPMSKEAEQAANLILDSFALVEDWDSLKSNSKLYFDQQGLGSPDFKKEVYGIYENASLQLVENNFKKSGDKAKGAADYTAFYKEFPSSAKADIALNNATVYLNDLGKTTEAIPLRLEIINKFPKSKYYKDQVAAVGFDYESQANFSEAANWYEKLYTLDKAHPGSAAAIFSAALFRDALGQWETSIKDYQAYMTSYPDKPGLNQLKLGIAKTYENQTKLAEASKIYLEFFTKPPVNASLDEVMFARMRYGLLMDKLGQGANVTKHWNDTLTYFAKAITPVGGKPATEYELSREYVGQIKYILAEPEFKKFTSMRINGPTSKVSQKVEDKTYQDQLIGKAKGLVAIEKTYTDVLNTGAGEWGLAALTKLGKVYEDMADTFANSKCPSYLTSDQCEIYGAQIGDKAFPQIEKAVATYSEALKKAYELNLYNKDTNEATRQLGVLRPLDYPGLYEDVPQNRFTAPAVTTESFETEP
jgi:tetratricopeptide (TPR) repeat protein